MNYVQMSGVVDAELRAAWHIGEPRRMYVRKRGGKCSHEGCDAERSPWGRYCLPCKNAYMREWRKTHPQTGEAKLRAKARSYAHVYRDRGWIQREPCADCAAENVEMHHEDYTKPLEVTWLCRPCHLARHGKGPRYVG